MLITFILQILQAVLIWVIDFLPDSSFLAVPVQIEASVEALVGYASGWNFILPVAEALDIMKWTIIILSYLVLWHILKKVFLGWVFFRDSGSSPDIGVNVSKIYQVGKR